MMGFLALGVPSIGFSHDLKPGEVICQYTGGSLPEKYTCDKHKKDLYLYSRFVFVVIGI